MAVCSECENSIDAFFILAEPLHDNVYGLSRSSGIFERDMKAKVEKTRELKNGLCKNLFKEYNSVCSKFDETLNQFTRERTQYFHNERTIYSLETLAFLGDESSTNSFCSVGIRKDRDCGTITSGKEISGTECKYDYSNYQGSNENQRDAIHNSLLRNVGRQQQGLAEVQQRITRDSTAYDEFLERSHVTSLEKIQTSTIN